MPRLLCRKIYKWLPSRFVAHWCCLTLLSKASLPSDMFSSTVAMQELCSGKDIFSFDFNSVTCLLNSMMIVPDWVWSQPLWMATADGSHQTLVESSLSRFWLDMAWNVFSTSNFVHQEFEFYSCCGEALTSLSIFLFTSLIAVLGSKRRSRSCHSFFWSSLPTLLTGLLLAYCTSFLKLVALLWSTPDTAFLWSFVDLLFLLTSVSVLRVLTSLSTPACWAAALSSHLAMHFHTTLSSFITSSWV